MPHNGILTISKCFWENVMRFLGDIVTKIDLSELQVDILYLAGIKELDFLPLIKFATLCGVWNSFLCYYTCITFLKNTLKYKSKYIFSIMFYFFVVCSFVLLLLVNFIIVVFVFVQFFFLWTGRFHIKIRQSQYLLMKM